MTVKSQTIALGLHGAAMVASYGFIVALLLLL